MSITMKASAGAPQSINPAREHSYLWTTVLILGVIAACAIAGSFYVGGPGLDASVVGKTLLTAI